MDQIRAALHTVWDSIGGLPVYAVLAALAFALLVATTHRLSRPDAPAAR